jgi:diguanylate cyclase (GGDEF)-like protein/PAS domain S-box-containing protein
VGRPLSSIRSQLVQLVLAVMVPLIAATAWIGWDAYSHQREALGRSMIDTARALAGAADRELAEGEALLETLALSSLIDERRFEAFYALAARALASRPGTSLLLVEPGGQVVLNTARPFGSPLPNLFDQEAARPPTAPDELPLGAGAFVRQVFETRQPRHSDLFLGRVRNRPLVGVIVPVLREGRVTYCLSLGMPIKAMQDLLARQRSAREGEASLIDARGFLIARALAPERYVGQLASQSIRDAIAAAPEGFGAATTLEDRKVFFAHTRSEVSGWTAAVGIGEQEALGLIWGPLRRWIVAVAILLCAGLAVALVIARRIARPMRELALATKAMQRGENVALPHVHTLELEQLGTAVEYAMHELRSSGERLRTIMDSLPALIGYIDADERYRFNNRAYEQWLGRPLGEITGKTVREVMGEAQYAKVQPRIERALRGAQVIFQMDFRIGQQLMHVQTTYLPDFDSRGAVRGFYVLSEDVGSLVQAHKELHDAQERLHFALKGSHTALWDTDLRTRAVVLSPAWAEMLGAPSAETRTTVDALQALAHPDDLPVLLKLSVAAMKGTRPDYKAEHRVRAKDGRWIWILSHGTVLERDPASGQALRMIGINMNITERKLAEQRMQQLAQHDMLTGLANRAVFQDRMEHAAALSGRVSSAPAVLYLDIDHFKSVNDRLGHAAGDELLKEFAGRLTGCLRSADTAARLGGDEFAALLEMVRNEENAAMVAQKILDAMRAPMRIAGEDLTISVSIGIAVYAGEQDYEAWLRRADAALYEVKKSGRNAFRLAA